MGSRLDDELDQILKNTSFESGNELDQTKNSSKATNCLSTQETKNICAVESKAKNSIFTL